MVGRIIRRIFRKKTKLEVEYLAKIGLTYLQYHKGDRAFRRKMNDTPCGKKIELLIYDFGMEKMKRNGKK